MFNFGNIAEMTKQFKNIQENVKKAQEELRNEKILVEVGGGMIKITVNGMGEVLDLDIDESLLKPENKEMLTDLLISAMNEAQARSKEVMAEKMQEASGLPSNLGNLGGLF